MSRVLLDCSQNENISLQPTLATQIAQKCQGNMRKALLMLEAMYVQQYFCIFVDIPL